MTTKVKIIAGFVIMVVLLAIVAVIGYNSTVSLGDGFTEYRRLANVNVYTSDMVTQINHADTQLSEFIMNRNKEFIDGEDGALVAVDKAVECVDNALGRAVSPEVIEGLNKTKSFLATYRTQIGSLRDLVISNYAFYEESVLPEILEMTVELKQLSQQALLVNNITVMGELVEVWEDLSVVRAKVNRYVLSMDKASADDALQGLSQVVEDMVPLERDLISVEGRRMMGAIKTRLATLQTCVNTMVTNTAALQKQMSDLKAFMRTEVEAANALSAKGDANMRGMGENVASTVAFSKTLVLIVSAVGVVLGIGITFLIVHGIIRVLRELSMFAGAVAKGNFTYNIKVKEGGEIGSMVSAMREIPAVLEKVISEATDMAGKISAGYFRDRLKPEEFHGEYGTLAESVNRVGHAYTGVIDAIPVPVVSYNMNNERLFINRLGYEGLGDAYVSQETGAFDTSFGAKAKERNGTYSAETVVVAKGENFDMAITARPLHSSSGDIVGHLEILNNLTEVKGQQRTILRVANEASGISERVAAASEEIAAQVEEISRGTEIQRSRVESTATAMTEMNSTVLEVASNASQASEQTDNTRNKAEDGARLVNKVVSSINSVAESSATMQRNMEELGRQADSIGEVMNVISDIADQTNLLALNAAIEAARAGEAGRGFAVVADEVRKLAEKTMSATQEVGNSITSIQHSARTSIEEVNKSSAQVMEATELANTSGTALQEILNLATSNSSIVSSIATAAEEQSATSEEINQAIEEINRIVAETNDGMVQSSEAVQELSRMAQELRSMMEALK